MTLVSEDFDHYQNKGVASFQLDLGVVEVRGPDSADFLQRMTTQDVKNISVGKGAYNALLQSNAMIISIFKNYNLGTHFLLVTELKQARLTADTLEKFHFTEDLEIRNLSDKFSTLSIQGPKSENILKSIVHDLPAGGHEVKNINLLGFEVIITNEKDFKDQGFYLIFPKEKLKVMEDQMVALGIPALKQEIWNLLRVEAGHFQLGIDVGEKNLILEAPMSDYISRSKGCYPGQEVVERVFTYGNVAKKLVSLSFMGETPRLVQAGAKIFKVDDAEKEVGLVTTSAVLPWSKEIVVLAMVRKPFYKADQVLKVNGIEAKVKILPSSFAISEEI